MISLVKYLQFYLVLVILPYGLFYLLFTSFELVIENVMR